MFLSQGAGRKWIENPIRFCHGFSSYLGWKVIWKQGKAGIVIARKWYQESDIF